MKNIIVLLCFLYTFFSVSAKEILMSSPRCDLNVSGGAAIISYPIELPPAAGNFKPNLKLIYNSNGSDGYLGMGWQISAYQIIESSIPSYAYDEKVTCEQNTYRINGERLIEVKSSNDTVYYRKAVDDNTIVKRFDHADSYDFIAVLPNGTEQMYSFSSHGIFYLMSEKDRNGNIISYEWSQDIADLHHNMWRLSKISYNETSISEKVVIKFNYKIRTNPFSKQSGGKIHKFNYILDNINVILGDNLFRHFDLTYNSYCGHDVIVKIVESGENGDSLNPTEFIWKTPKYKKSCQEKIKKSLPTNLINEDSKNWMMADCDGDGEIEMLIWQNTEIKRTNDTLWICKQNVDSLSHSFYVSKIYHIPSNGQIIQPLIGCFFDKYKPTILAKIKSGSDLSIVNMQTGEIISNDIMSIIGVADMDNDGYDEIVDYDNYKNYEIFIRSLKKKTTKRIRYDFLNRPSFFIADYDGDGLLDIGCGQSVFAHERTPSYNGTTIFDVWKNKGIGIDDVLDFSSPIRAIEMDKNSTFHGVADFNGDGLPDILFGYLKEGSDTHAFTKAEDYLDENRQGIFYSRGSFEFKKIDLERSFDLSYGFTDKENGKCGVKIGDFNGDGKSDLFFFSAVYYREDDIDGEWGEFSSYKKGLLFSVGETFEVKNEQSNRLASGLVWSDKIRVCDIDRDGKDELCYMDRNYLLPEGSHAVQSGSRIRYVSDFPLTDDDYGTICNFSFENDNLSISKVYDSNGDVCSISYSKLYEVCDNEKDPQGDVGTYKGFQMVVDSVELHSKKYKYSYSSLLYDKTGRGLLGFAEETVTDVSSNKETKKTYGLEPTTLTLFPQKGEIFINNNIVSSTKSEFEVRKENDDYPCKILQTRKEETDYLTGISTTTEFSDFNKAGMPQNIVTNYGGLVTKTIKTNYTDADGWKGSLPTKTSTIWENATGKTYVESVFEYDKKGNVIKSETFPGQKNQLTVSYEYDGFGNIIKIDSLTSSIIKEYDYIYSDGGFLLSKKDPYGKTTVFTYENGFLSSATSALNEIIYERDVFGQILKTSQKDGSWIANERRRENKKIILFSEEKGGLYLSESPSNIWIESQTNSIGGKSVTEYFNGNPILTKTASLKGDTICQKNIYDNDGKLIFVSELYRIKDEPIYGKIVYDIYGRIIRKETPKDTIVYSYNNLTTIQNDGTFKIISESDASGRLASISKNGKSVDFVYDPMGNIISATPQDGEPVVAEYDAFGRRTRISDPSAGTILTNYDAFGNILSLKQCVHNSKDTVDNSFAYNEVGLLAERQIIGKKKYGLKYEYDEFGRVVKQSDNIHIQSISYDSNGNVSSVEENIDDLTFKQTFEYDSKNRMYKKISPSGLTLRATYDDEQKPIAISKGSTPLWQLMEENEIGLPTWEKYNNIDRVTKYDKRGMPISDSIANMMHYQYLFDNQGNMLQKKDNIANQEEVFLFDEHNRLSIWRTFEKDTLCKEITATYDDVFGNMTSRSDSDMVFNYGEFGHSPHALTSIDAPLNSHRNKACRYSYTDFKMLESATNGVDSIFITYGVDFQRRRMKIFKNDSLILTRYYFSDYEEEHYADGRIRKIDYITGPTGLIGVNISTDGVDSLLYAFTDRFGNLVMLVDGNKNIVERLAYDPWGARRNPADWTKPDTASHILSRGYSMHEHLDCLGLINMNARVYEPATCSFLSPDPLIADEGNWLNYNRYLYCFGNPVKFADPTGMYATEEEATAAMINAMLAGITDWASVVQNQYPAIPGSGGNYSFNTINFNESSGFYETTSFFSGFESYSNLIYGSSNSGLYGPLYSSMSSQMVDMNAIMAEANRMTMDGISKPTTFEKVSLVSSLVCTNQTFEDAIFAWSKVEFNKLGAVGKVMTSTSTAVTIGGTVIGAIGGGINISEGKPIRGSFDIGMAFAGLVGAYIVSNSALIAGCAWAGPVGWTLIGVSVAYSVTVAFIDVLDN